MAATSVNLDALIPREDFETASSETATNPSNLGNTMRVTDLGPDSLWYNVLRKPDFQRETANWTPEKIAELVSSFLEGDLIPAVILWRSPTTGNLFVIDGAHRVSALIAWLHDDYGDGVVSRRFFEDSIPSEQLKAASATRALIAERVGSYADLTMALRNPDRTSKERLNLARNMTAFALTVQWVLGGAEKAETSFFKINQQAALINNIELDMIKARRKPNAVAARAFIRAGTGHKYWSTFDDATKSEIESIAKEVYDLIFTPDLDTQIRTSDLPAAGRGYSADSIQMLFELVNFVNELSPDMWRQASLSKRSSTKNAARRPLEDDIDGQSTITFMRRVKRATSRVVGKHPGSLGLHPAVYFYSATGRFQASAFLAAIAFTRELEESRAFDKFTRVRMDFEEFLVEHQYFLNQIVQRFGSFMRSVPTIMSLYRAIFQALLEGRPRNDIFLQLTAERPYLKGMTEEDRSHRRNFSANTKNATVLRNVLGSAPRCGICGARVNLRSMTIDHVERREDGGSGTEENAQLSHPYCNSGYKEGLHAARMKD
ncbi:HNH endonuclease signature motif containing protein [Actinomadura chokoriensis]|uniref:HNH endonuclease n=1 Tax=Actinomadura chokoriensis TaxID=454156 RepID=UPI0031F978D0